MKPPSLEGFRKSIVLLVMLFMVFIAFPQSILSLDPEKKVHHYPVSVWSTEDGLPQNSVISIIQSGKGYIWIGTERGIARFDGVRFTVFNSAKNPNIRNNRITVLLEDKEGNLYSGSRGGGLNRFKNGHVESFLTGDGLKDNFVLSLFEDSQNRLWIGTFKGLSRIDKEKGLYTYDSGGIFNDKIIMAITETPDGSIWIGTFKSGIFSISGDIVTHYRISDFPPDISIRTFLIDSNGVLWAGTNGSGLAVLTNGEFIPYGNNPSLSGLTVFSLLEDSDKNIWVGTAHGLTRITGNRISKWNEPCPLSGAIIRSFLEDHEGSLWIGTNNSGLVRLQNGKFGSISELDGLSSDNLTGVFEDSKGGLWIGTDGKGVNYIPAGQKEVSEILKTARGLPSDFVYTIAEDRMRNIWLGTGKGIAIVDPGSFSVKRTIGTGNGLPNEMINVLYRTRNDSIWAGTSGGGAAVFSDDRIDVFSTDNGLSNNFVHSIYEDDSGSVWIGTYGGGVNRLKNGKFEYFNTSSGLSNDFIFSINSDDENNIWIGTGGGLNRISGIDSKRMKIGTILRSDTIYNIFILHSGDLWLSSNIGLYNIKRKDISDHFNGIKKELPHRLFNSRDGLNSDECVGGVQPAGYRSRSGKLFIPTTKGLAIIDPDLKLTNTVPPGVFIEKVEADFPYRMDNGIAIFPGRTKKITFDFTALSFLIPERVEFKVKMEGFDNEWSGLHDTRNRSVSYTNLSAGTYRFRVIASNSDGEWNREGAEFLFRINSLFYASPAFLVISGIMLLLLFLYFYRLRIRNIRKRESELERIVDDRTNELRSSNIRLTEANEQKSELLSMAAHDLKNPLQAVIGFSELISLRKDCPDNIKKNAHLILEASKGMLETIENTLNSTVIREGKMKITNEETIDLSELSRLAVEIYSEFAKKKNQIVITRFWNDCYIKGERERIKIVVENLLSNAIKYSPLNKNIVLSVEKAGKNIILSVKDEGAGFSEEDKKNLFEKFRRLSSKPTAGESSTGIGLSIVKRIVEMHGGKIWLESAEDEGSVFFVSFPVVSPVDTWKMK